MKTKPFAPYEPYDLPYDGVFLPLQSIVTAMASQKTVALFGQYFELIAHIFNVTNMSRVLLERTALLNAFKTSSQIVRYSE
jgi:hypothetical protein